VPQNRFYLVPQIVAEEKYFDCSVRDILWNFNKARTKFQVTWPHEIVDESTGEVVELNLTLNVSGNLSYPLSWDVALLLHNTRIDGIGYHPWFNDVDGNEQAGWHRHVWNEREQHAKGKKRVSGFDGELTFEEFLIRAFKALRVSCNKEDSDPELF
jgi:hypothetical protein